MAKLLKQSTATTILLGPFVDKTDGNTAETGLTLTQSDIQVWKEGGTNLNAKNESTAATHAGLGCYYVPLNATDTNTLGQLIVAVHESAEALPVRHDFLVVKDHVYDTFCGSDFLQVDVKQIASTGPAATKLAASAGTIVSGTVDDSANTPTTTVFEAADITEATADHYIGRVIIFTSGNLIYQATEITDYALVGANASFTVTAMTEAPSDGDTFVIV
jgi:hypothetical protein